MPIAPESLDAPARRPTLEDARARLAEPAPRREKAASQVLGAAALCAVSAIALASAVILGPGPLGGHPDDPRAAAFTGR